MRYFFHSMKMLLKSAAQYRASFVAQSIGQLVMTGGDLLAVLVLMDRFNHVGQWQPAQVLFFFGVMHLCFAFTECFGRGISTFANYVGSGEFDTMLIRPRGLMLQVICARLDARRFISIVVGASAMALASINLQLVWTWEKAALLCVCVVGSVLLLMGLFLVEATFSFFSVRSIEAVNVLTYGGRSACQYPVDIYPKPIRLLFTYVAPFALCMHVPVSVIIGRPMLVEKAWQAFLTPLAGAVFFAVMVAVWYAGARRYRSTGS